MSGTWSAVVHVRPSGERLPLLLRPDGVPDQDVTIYTTRVLRARSGSYNTLLKALYGVLALRRFTASSGIDLEARIRTQDFLAAWEWSQFVQEVGDGVKSATLAARLHDALRFVAWRIRCRLWDIRDPMLRADFEGRAALFLDEAAEQIPPGGGEGSRDALDPEQRRLLVGILRSPDELRKLWPNEFARTRNEALLWWLVLLGHRIGETLAMLLTDLDIDNLRLTIVRRHDSPDDPRGSQRLVKGRGRRLTVPPALVEPMSLYLEMRRAMPLTHDYLFAAATGGPLSGSAVTKVLARLVTMHPALTGITPHVLRHTWIAEFRAAAKSAGLDEADKSCAEALAMGWSDPASDRFYAIRQRLDAAEAISLRLQREMMGGAPPPDRGAP